MTRTAQHRPAALTIGSLFTGMGGLDLAVEAVLDARVAWVSDIDKGACKILACRFPDVPNLGDITAVDWSTVPRVDIITGGYPCQPFSQAGRRLGQEDERHLWPYVRDAIAVLRPPMVVFENVRGHLTLGFDEVVRDLHQLGYDVEWVLIKASDLGACHQRARLFILGVNRERRVRSGLDRWGRLHRHSADRWVVSSASQGQHDGQGTACPACSQEAVRRQGGAGQRTDGDHAGVAHVAADGRVCDCRHQETAAPVLGEGGCCGRRAGVRCDADRLTEASEPWPLLDGRDARPGSDAEASDSGSESSRTGPRAAHAAGCEAACGLPLGLVVGAGGRPVRAGGVPGWHADEWQHGCGTPVRSPGAGSDGDSDEGPPADSDLTGLQGLADSSGAAPAERHGHAFAGAGGPDLTLLPTPRCADGVMYDLRTDSAALAAAGPRGRIEDAIALLPTPAANLGSNGGPQRPDKRRAGGHSVSIEDAVHGLTLLPTPTTEPNTGNGHARNLGEEVQLLPTPTTTQRGTDANLDTREGARANLHNAVLLPTPRTENNENRQSEDYGMNLGMALGTTPGYEHNLIDREGDQNAHTTDPTAGQDLPGLRGDIQPQEIQRATGEQCALHVAPDLLSVVREYETGSGQGHVALACAEALGFGVRHLWDGRGPACPSHRPEPGEQRPGEPGDTLRLVPPQAALARGSREADYSHWGKYAAAIRSHERLTGRPAPAPTELGPKGKPRLSARFCEWMMCLPDGWVTDVPGLTRNEALKALGNGVVVPQCATALRIMLGRTIK